MVFGPFRHGGPPVEDNFFRRPPPFPAVKPRSSLKNRLDAAAKSSLANEKSSPPRCEVRRRSAACVHPWFSICVYRCGESWCGVVAMWRGWGEGGVPTPKTKEGESGGVRVGSVGELMYGCRGFNTRPLIGSNVGKKC